MPQQQAQDPYEAFGNTKDPYADLGAQVGPSTRGALRTAVETNPDDAAEALRLRKRFPGEASTLLRVLPDAKREARLQDMEGQLANSPRLAGFVRENPVHAAALQDDLPALATIESSAGAVAAAGAAQAVLGVSESLYRTPDTLQRLAGAIAARVEKTGLPWYLNPIRGVQDVFRFLGEGRVPGVAERLGGTTNIANQIARSKDILADDPETFGPAFRDVGALSKNADIALATAIKEGDPKKMAEVLTDGRYWSAFLAQSVPSLYLAAKSGGSTAFMAWLEGMGQANNAAEFEKKTGIKMGDEEFSRAVMQTAVANALLEKYGLDKVLGAKGAGLKGIAKALFAEGATEGLQEVSSNLAALLNYDQDKSLLEGVLSSVMGGAGSGAAVSTASAAAQRLQQRLDQQRSRDDTVQKGADRLKAQLQAAAASVLRERSPETFNEVMQATTDGSVYVDAEVLRQLPPDVLQQLPESARSQLDAAEEAGSTVALPVADMLTIAPGTPLEQVLVDFGRTAPDAPSLVEVKQQGEQAQQWIEGQLDEVLRQAADQDALEASRAAVQAKITEQVAATGRFSSSVAEAYGALTAAFFTVQAERLRRSGASKWAQLTPEGLFDQWNLKVTGGTGSGQVLNDLGGAPDGRLDAVEGYHFSMADRPTISTEAYGSNYAGSNKDLYLNAADQRLRNRAYFYVDKGTGINPESGVGGRGHRVSLDNVYDADRDPLKLKRGGDQLAFESAVLDAGFGGYLSRLEGTQSGQVIMLGKQQFQAELLGPTSRIPAGKRVPALPSQAPQWQVLATGTPEQLQARLTRMQGNPSWAGYDVRLENGRIEVRPKDQAFSQRAEGDTRYRALAIERLATIRPPKRSAVAIMQGTEKPPVFRNIFELSRWFTQKNRRGAEDMDDPAVRRRMLDALYADTLMALTDAGSAVGWYDAKVKAALDIVAQLHPEIATNEEARFGFITVLAITSNQTKVVENFELANAIYTKWKQTGELPTDVGSVMDTRAKTEMSKSLAKMRDLIAEHGWTRMREFMTTKQPARDIEAFTGYPVTGEGKDSLVYGAVFLGPKIGAFFNNLYGNFDTVTMDRWWMRTINRIRGSMLDLPASFGSNLDDLAAQFEANPDLGLQFGVTREQVLGDIAAYKALDAQAQGDVLVVLDALPNIERYAKERHKLFARGRVVGGRERSYVDRTPENQLAKNIDLAMHGDQQTPRGGADRELMRELVFKLQQKLKADGIDMVAADIQAALWYYEKDLVARLKGQAAQAEMFSEVQEAEDYETAARRLLAAGRGDAGRGGAGPAGRARAQRAQGGSGGETLDLFAQRADDALSALEGQQDGNREGRAAGRSLAPLPGAPNVQGATGPDPRLVAVAEQYAADNGIELTRQREYVEVDPERAARIAAAYDAMPHAPNDPKVAEAYQDLIEQTIAQYRALEAAGYRFYFFDETNDPYQGNPWNAMRDLRANQTMAVFASEAGFGSGATELDTSGNPLLADTGITWPYGSLDGEPKRVLANDLFRAVHDAFGHGLEGAGFRAQGEENAWQAHVRLFTGPAVGAITTETRGQNSWLNYGPYGEQNRNAKVEDTVFADQKTGLMPEWTWTEGRADDALMEQGEGQQQALGTYSPSRVEIALNKGANLSTFLHELGHFFLEVQTTLAADPEAPADLKADTEAVLKWFGVESLEAWRAMPFEAKEPLHEQWAESFERYLLTGRAPSNELQPLFRKFRAWMLAVYKSLKQMLERRPRAQALNPDIARVFDRMLAVEEQIAETEEALALASDPEATAVAQEKLTARSLRDLKWTVRARDKFIKQLQMQARATRERIIGEVKAVVDELPVVKAKLHLDALSKNPDREAALAIRRDARAEVEKVVRQQVITERLGDQDIKGLAKGQWLSRNRRDIAVEVEKRMIAWDRDNPVPPPLQNVSESDLAVVADSFGFATVEEMLQAVKDFGDPKDVVDALAEQRMLEEHGDLIDERAIQEAANEAVHNEARARALANELNAQSQMLNARRDTGETTASGAKRTVSVLVEAAKEFGAKIAGSTLVRDLKETTWRHLAAEQRAGRRWYAATRSAQAAEAADAKRAQLLNNGAVRALQEAKADVLKAREFFKLVLKGNDEKVVEKGRDPDIINAARAVLKAYGFETPTTRAATAYLETLSRMDPATSAVVTGYIEHALANAQPADALTIDQLRELHETIRAMWNLAKESRTMEVKGDKLDIEDAAEELSDQLATHSAPLQLPGQAQALTKADQRRAWLQYAGAWLRRVEAWAEALDGKYGGPFHRLVFQPIKDAADRYRTDRIEYRKKLTDLLQNVAPALDDKPIDAPEIGYTFGKGHNGVGHAELLHALLHTGNPSNKRKLLLGRGWATLNADGTMDTTKWDGLIARLQNQGVLRKEHYDFVQRVWDLMESTKPGAQDAHRKVFGRYFSEVASESFETPWGSYRGGYVPAQADPRLVQDAALRNIAEAENQSMAYSFPATNRGFTQSRVEYNRPLVLDIRTLAQHLDKVLLFTHMEAPVRSARRLLVNKKVSTPLGKLQPAAYAGMLLPWLNRSARQIVEDPVPGDGGISRILPMLRARAGMALMMGNLSNTMQQVTGFSSALPRVGAGNLMRAVAQYIAHPAQFKEAVYQASPSMATRMNNEVSVMSGIMEDILVSPTRYERMQRWAMQHSHFLQAAVDNVFSPIVWTAAYNRALAQGMADPQAVDYADSTVRQTQHSSLPEDVSRMETGSPFARLFTQFMGYFNMVANTNVTAVKQVIDQVGVKKGALPISYIVLMGVLTPVWLAEGIAQAMRGGPGDEDDDGYLDDWLKAVFGFGTIKGLLAAVPGAAQAGQLVLNRFNDNPADDRMSLSPAISLIESATAAPFSVADSFEKGAVSQKAVRDVAALVTMVTGLPATPLARPLGYVAGVASDSVEPEGPVDAARGLVTGVASKESRQ